MEFWHPYLGIKKAVFHNLTEVHYFFNKEFLHEMREWAGRSKQVPQECFHSVTADLSYAPRCAFESNIHGTGGHRAIPIMERLVVTQSDKLHEKYMEVLEEVSREEADKAWDMSREHDNDCLYKS